MRKSNRDIDNRRKKVGRPRTTGTGEQVIVRLHEPMLGMIDRWAAGQDDALSRPEAIRRLLALALAADHGAKPRQLAPDDKDRARSVREVRTALEHTKEKIELALAAIEAAEAKLPKS